MERQLIILFKNCGSIYLQKLSYKLVTCGLLFGRYDIVSTIFSKDVGDRSVFFIFV